MLVYQSKERLKIGYESFKAGLRQIYDKNLMILGILKELHNSGADRVHRVKDDSSFFASASGRRTA